MDKCEFTKSRSRSLIGALKNQQENLFFGSVVEDDQLVLSVNAEITGIQITWAPEAELDVDLLQLTTNAFPLGAVPPWYAKFETNSENTDSEHANSEQATAENDNKEARTLTSFNYALKDKQELEGVILTDRTVAVSFRNFLLSSTGQGILEKYDYYNINGYENSVNDLFQPTSRAKKASGDNPVDVADALSNGDK